MVKRRDFITKSALATVALGISATSDAKARIHSTPPTVLKPKRLKKGNVIGLVAPGYAFSPELLENSIQTVIGLGMEPYYTDRVLKRQGYLSNTDEERAADLMHMFSNPKVDAIFCIRGGYGCTRILDRLNYDVIAQNPKILIGYSDITALLQAFYIKTGLVGFHGAMGPEPKSYAYKQMKMLLMKSAKSKVIKNYEFDQETLKDPVFERYTITPGKTSGKLVGGNLSLMAAMTGTMYDIDYTNCLVCIEDIGEAPYRIDRMLTQLLSTKTFKNAAGIIFGVCKGCDKKEGSESFTLKEVIMDRIAPMKIPAVYGMSFGHIEENFTFPVGIEASLDASECILKLNEEPLV